MKLDIAVVIPVYNAFAEASECIQSVSQYSPEAKKILIIDDASKEGDFAEFLSEKINLDQRIKFIRNQKNLGFVESCNLAFEECKSFDVILLNSDTIVTPDWLCKLQDAAYSASNIATVSALSNNAVICSVPNFCVDNIIPANLNINDFSEIVSNVSEYRYPELPTAMGFCMFIRRSALLKIGYFDAAAFKLGYGEENDFSQRAIKFGFKNICADSVFVYHKGNCSFLGLQSDLSKNNGAILNQRYPHYFDEISRFCRSNPLLPIQQRIQEGVLESLSNNPRVLHIIHNGPTAERRHSLGGTELQVKELIERIDDVNHYSLVRYQDVYYLSAHFKGGQREYILSAKPGQLTKLLKPEYFDLLHLHHALWFDDIELKSALLVHGNYLISMHDYFLICPEFYLYTTKKKACTGFECQSACGYSTSIINKRRADTLNLINSAKRVICFSDDTKANYDRILPNTAKWLKIPHALPEGLDIRQSQSTEERSLERFTQQRIKLGLIGYFPDHKGRRLIKELENVNQINGITLEWHLFGKLFDANCPNLLQHGEYKRSEITQLLKDTGIDIILILSECHETYSYTLDEAWAAGIPVIVTPLGAPAERVRSTSAGWILPELTPSAVCQTIDEIFSNPIDYQIKLEAVKTVKLYNITEQCQSYAMIYNEYSNPRVSIALQDLQQMLKSVELSKLPEPSVSRKLAGKLVNFIIWNLDVLGIRYSIQNLAYRILPKSFSGKLKGLR